MTPFQVRTNQFLQYFSQTTQSTLTLKHGVCAIYNTEHQQVAVIEAPESSENIIFHCSLHHLSEDISPQVLKNILQLNFEISAMQGCWLAIDEQNQLNLCYVQPIEQTDEQHFSDTLVGFIEQVKDIRAFTSALL